MVLDFETTSNVPCSDFTRPVQIGFFIAQGTGNKGRGITVFDHVFSQLHQVDKLDESMSHKEQHR